MTYEKSGEEVGAVAPARGKQRTTSCIAHTVKIATLTAGRICLDNIVVDILFKIYMDECIRIHFRFHIFCNESHRSFEQLSSHARSKS